MKSTNVFALQSRNTNLYASTSSGLFRSSDGGTNWIRFGPGGRSLAISEPNFNTGSGRFVVCSTDTSVGWEWIPVGSGQIRALAFSGTDLFVGLEGDSAGVYIFTHNAPGSHTIIRTLLKDTDVYSLLVNDTGIFAGTAGGVFLSTDNGVNWAPLNNGLTQLE